MQEVYDAVVVGGGPAGATAAHELSSRGYRVSLLHWAARPKPCGGAVPPVLFSEFDVPRELCQAAATEVRLVLPSARELPIDCSPEYVGLVSRERFDAYLRDRAAAVGTEIIQARCTEVRSVTPPSGGARSWEVAAAGRDIPLRARIVIGADGASSKVRREIGVAAPAVYSTLQERWRIPENRLAALRGRLWVYVAESVSPCFYAWVFPKLDYLAIGTAVAPGLARSLETHLTETRRMAGSMLEGGLPFLREGAPLPVSGPRSLGRDTALLVGDAAGCVAPGSGEGIYYAMKSARLAAEAARYYLSGKELNPVSFYRKTWDRSYRRTFRRLSRVQTHYYRSDGRRERFGALCADPLVARLAIDTFVGRTLPRIGFAQRVKILWRAAKVALAA